MLDEISLSRTGTSGSGEGREDAQNDVRNEVDPWLARGGRECDAFNVRVSISNTLKMCIRKTADKNCPVIPLWGSYKRITNVLKECDKELGSNTKYYGVTQ